MWLNHITDVDFGRFVQRKGLVMKIKHQGNLTTVYDSAGQLVLATSYDTCLFVRKGSVSVYNGTKYSVTTSRHQNRVMCLTYIPYTVFDVPVGADADTLLHMARA